MKIWTNTKFEGHESTGAAVVVADTAEDAMAYLNMMLKLEGLEHCKADQFEELPFEKGMVIILNNGNHY